MAIKESAIETAAERQARLRPVLGQLKQSEHSAFLDLCELVLMLAEEIDGSIKWDHPRVVVHVRQRVAAERSAKRRGIALSPAHRASWVIPPKGEEKRE
jgi:hypothetical protein